MSLDILTPKGQESAAQEMEQLEILSKADKSVGFIHTPKGEPSDVDGFITRDGAVTGMFMSSCRKSTREQMRKWGDEFILTNDKVVKATQLAKQLCLPVYAFVYLVPDKLVLVQTLINKRGEVMPAMRVLRTKTQATINGGEVVRSNAYISLDGAWSSE